MPKRIANLLIASFLALFFIPSLAFGIDISSKLSSGSAVAGESITVSGCAEADTWVSIKGVDSTGNIVFFEATKSDSAGDYTCTFIVPQIPAGTITIVTGYGNNVDNKHLQIVSGGSANGGGSTPSVAASRTVTDSGGTVQVAGIEVVIPAGTVEGSFKVSVEKLTSDLPLVASEFKAVGEFYEITSDQRGEFKKAVTITLPFDISQVDLEKEEVAIYFWDNTKWVILDNITVDKANGKVSGETTHFTTFTVLSKEKESMVDKVLNDIEGNWAIAEINQMYSAGIISGYPDGSFKPNKPVTRAEFVTILAKAFQLEADTSRIFEDTRGHWAQDSISTAAANKVVSGYSDRLFGPDDFITREQMAVMIVNAADLTDKTDAIAFSDQDQFSAWAQEAIIYAAANNLITGYPDNSFQPKNNATRAEAAAIVARAMQL